MSMAVDQDAAARRVVKARHEVGDGRLARAAAADQGDDRAAGHDDVEVADDRPAFAVLELDVLEADLVDDARGVDGVGPVGLVVGHRQHFEHALHRGQRTLQLGERVDDVPDRVEQQERVPLEGHDVADRGAAHDVQVTAVPDDDDVDAGDEQAPGGPEDQLAAMGEQLLAEDGVPAAHVVEQLAHFAAERADDANAGERLADAAVDLLDVLADGAVDGPDAAGRGEAHEHGAGNDGQGHEGQSPVERQAESLTAMTSRMIESDGDTIAICKRPVVVSTSPVSRERMPPVFMSQSLGSGRCSSRSNSARRSESMTRTLSRRWR